MDRAEILRAIELNKQKIYGVKIQLEQATGLREERLLAKKLKGLQYQQFWHLELLQNQDQE